MLEKLSEFYGYNEKVDAFKRSYNILKIVYNFFINNYKVFIPLIYTLTAFWQAYMISDIIDNMSVFYYIDLQYSIILFVKMFTLIILIFFMSLILILFITFTPFFFGSILLLSAIGTLLSDSEIFNFLDNPIYIIIPWILINIFYYYLNFIKTLMIGAIMFSIIIGIFSGFKELNILKIEKNNVKIILDNEKVIDGVLNFYNGKYYFIENGKSKEVINDKFVFKVVFK